MDFSGPGIYYLFYADKQYLAYAELVPCILHSCLLSFIPPCLPRKLKNSVNSSSQATPGPGYLPVASALTLTKAMTMMNHITRQLGEPWLGITKLEASIPWDNPLL